MDIQYSDLDRNVVPDINGGASDSELAVLPYRADIFGHCLLDYLHGHEGAALTVYSDKADTEEWPMKIFFRSWADMPALERRALKACRGTVLDLGAGAGSHSLKLQEMGLEVDALDISEGAAEVMRSRGVSNVFCADLWSFEPSRAYDTIIMPMNGIGLAGTLDRVSELLRRLRGWLAPKGQILVESCDLSYLYYDEEDGSYVMPLVGYFGEMTYTYVYQGQRSESFPWVFVDKESLRKAAGEAGLCFEVLEDEESQFLGRLG